jgi:hypothetical protein
MEFLFFCWVKKLTCGIIASIIANTVEVCSGMWVCWNNWTTTHSEDFLLYQEFAPMLVPAWNNRKWVSVYGLRIQSHHSYSFGAMKLTIELITSVFPNTTATSNLGWIREIASSIANAFYTLKFALHLNNFRLVQDSTFGLPSSEDTSSANGGTFVLDTNVVFIATHLQ